MYYWRVFLWENGHKTVDYTKYCVAPIFIEDKLDETLDSGEVVLKAMPIATRNEFPPKTKFRLERYTKEDYTDEPRKWDFVVEHDDVEEYEGCPEICTHRVNLIEASVIAQGMHVDNIALTYELQDVDLNYKVVKSDTTKVSDLYGLTNGTNQKPAKGETITLHNATVRYNQGSFINSYKYEWDINSLNGSTGIKNLTLNIHAANSAEVTFTIPKLFVWGSSNDTAWNGSPLFQLNTVTRVNKILRYNGNQVSKTAVTFSNGSTAIRSGATTIADRNDSYCYCSGGVARLRKVQELNENNYNYRESFEGIYDTFPIVAEAKSSHPQQATFSTDVLSNDELDAGYTIDYEIIITADEAYQDGMVSYSKQDYMSVQSPGLNLTKGTTTCTTKDLNKESSSLIRVDTTIYCINLSEGANAPFVRKGVKYSCYDLLRKALLTCDTRLLNNEDTCLDEYGVTDASNGDMVEVKSLDYPIIVSDNPDENWLSRLKTAKMQETVFEQKNLWEVLLQIGYYLHAIPYLEFTDDGTDRFLLKFRQLGNTKTKADTSRKITVFNSLNLAEYFTQYDSYVTNLFSPQNLCEEWVTCKTSDPSYLVSNDTAEIQLKYPITEIIEFDIIYNGTAKSALSVIFEKSVYEILTNADPSQISPAKGNSIYYTLGGNKIEGLSYVAPSANSDNLMALKYIMQKLFGVNPSVWTQTYTFNNLRFRIKYRTQDEARITQFRPNLQDFMKNSSYEKYPHHEQYYGQQDKIIDSERFSANLYGKLIRVGNAIYQRQEYAESENEKESGDLVTINEEAYYVIATENEYYPDAIMQKVTYSKNFNQLSNIVGIPSEPRFYEVSERSKVRREVRIQEFFELSSKETQATKAQNAPVYMTTAWANFVKSLLFYKSRTLPNFAWMSFKADRLRKHTSANSGYTTADELFPSSDYEKTGNNTIKPLASSDHADCIVPLLHFPLHDGIVFEWDMEDNFKAGDYIDSGVSGKGSTVDGAYMAQQSLRYVDIMGRADLFRFALFNKSNWTEAQTQQLPKAVIEPPANSIIGVQGNEKIAIALDKDNREELSFNYQINLLHRPTQDDTEDFITFPNLFGEKDNDLKVCLLNQEQSQFDENVSITSAQMLADNVTYSFGTSSKGSITITFGNPTWIDGANISQVKSIVFYCENPDGGRTAYIVKNVARLPDGNKLQRLYIYPVYND